MKKQHLWIILVLICAVSIMAGCGESQTSTESSSNNANANSESNGNTESRTIRVGHVVDEKHVLHLGSVKFKEEVEKNSNGRINVEIFPRMQLGGEADMMEQLKNGSLDMLTPTIATLSSRSNSFNAWYMPYLLGSLEATNEMRKTEIAHEILNSLDPSEGVKPLGYYTIDNRHVLSSKKIEAVSDFRGLKVRIPPGQAIGDFYQALGASPTPVEQQEVYYSIQTGVVDAVDTDVDAVISNRYYEVANYLTLTGHHDWVCGVLYSQVLWDQLSDEDKLIIEEAVRVAEDYSYEISKQLHDELIEEVLENGVEIVEFKDTDAMLEIAEEIHNKYASDSFVAEFIEKAKEISAKYN